MKIAQKIARMAMGYDEYHINHDPKIPCGEAEQIAEEAENYLERLESKMSHVHTLRAKIAHVGNRKAKLTVCLYCNFHNVWFQKELV
jgi:hypothetical protein